MNLLEIVTIGMKALGDALIFFTLVCALLLIFIHARKARSSEKRPAPLQLVFAGWVGVVVCYIGMIAISRTDTFSGDIGLLYSMSLTQASLLLFLGFMLMLLGTLFTLRSRSAEQIVYEPEELGNYWAIPSRSISETFGFFRTQLSIRRK